ncbi:MAG: complex I NDUFA9 subunit family protein, partial [Beijerinckiaceae bacterium]
MRTPAGKLVTVFGGSGFVGRHVVRALAKRGYRVRAAVRRPDLAGHLQPMGVVGQIMAVQANVRYPESVSRAIAGADAVVNLVGILAEGGKQTFEAVHAEGADSIARAAEAAGLGLVHMSAIGAEENSDSLYARSKAAGEAADFGSVPRAIVLRPSIQFGPEDQFFNRFAAMARFSPALPLVGASTRLQPVFVGDVAEMVARSVDGA